MAKLVDVEGIGEKYAAKLKAAGIATMEALLLKGAAAKGRKELAQTSGISEAKLLEWVNRADLSRIKGVGEEYADLLEASGVDSVPELAQRRADNLHQRMGQVNETKKLVRRLPTEKQVGEWIAQAKALPRLVTH